MQHISRHHRPSPALVIESVIALLIILFAECCIFNLPHWRSLATAQSFSNDSYTQVPRVSTGKGIIKLDTGAFLITDPSQAYFETEARGPITYVQVTNAKTKNGQTPDLNADESKHLVSSIHVRLDLQGQATDRWTQAGSTTVSPAIDASLYIKNRSHLQDVSKVRVWIAEERKSVVLIQGLNAHPVVPFGVSLVRISIMACIAILCIALGPRSRLWQVPLNTSSHSQRLLFWLAVAAVAGWAAYNIAIQIAGFTVRTYHDPGAYTYDFNQYGHLADALLHGQAWLNLPVPDGLSALSNPYDISARERLLAAGEEPIFWDHVFYQNRWYSYFGPLPAVLIFAPYRLITSLFVPGGLMLPTPAACAILTAGFTLTCSLLIVRLIQRYIPKASIAATVLALLAFLSGSQVVYLYFRTDFYTVPFDASLLLSSLGLWFWLGARRVRTSAKHTQVWTIQYLVPGHKNALSDDRVYVSLPHVAAGTLAIVGTLGCRQTFIASALLALPIFSDEIWAMFAGILSSQQRIIASQTGKLPPPAIITPKRSVKIVLSVMLPALAVITPLLGYNYWRFGSAFNFGNTYQITVVDLNAYTVPTGNLRWLIVYYLFLPLTPSSTFPYLQRTPAPLPTWQYSEPGLGGLFTLAPVFALALFLLCIPAINRKLRAGGCLPLIVSLLILSCVLLLFTATVAGFDARYMLDFSWLIALAAVLPAVAGVTHNNQLPRRCTVCIRIVLLIALFVTLLFACSTALVEINRTPAFAHIQAWFSLL
ncbi:hypothetical protein BOCO_0613 [Bombiscardovia coagulans]|uniref:Glycosyltransferase n=1 Tax=Bombiscardovia coagulans TaxID=686666 RepID=A0A261ETW8_9BIFI|nr:hypothetical protein BOCO_0613 [Bombiscardovia coagulans]